MDSNHSTEILGSKSDVVCAWVGGANTTPYLFSAVHFAEQKTYNYFLLLQNMNSGDKKGKVPKPARIPPQTPPAGGKSAEAGRILSPRQIVSPCRVHSILLEKGSRKGYNFTALLVSSAPEAHPLIAENLAPTASWKMSLLARPLPARNRLERKRLAGGRGLEKPKSL